MTRTILVLALGVLFALGNVSHANPSPTPAAKVKKFANQSNHVAVEKSAIKFPPPPPVPQSQHLRGLIGGVPRSSATAGQTGNADMIPKPASSRDGDTIPKPITSRVITTPGGRSERVYTPNEYSEPDSPAAGPGFRTTGAPPESFKVRSQSNVVTSTATHKVSAAKVLIPQLSKNSGAAREDAGAESSIDSNPPTASELGAPIVIPMIPRYDAVPRSKVLYLPDGNIPVPVGYTPPAADVPTEVSPTALRAWNGEMTRETRTFDQTRVQATAGADGVRRWQFFWRTAGAKPRAARWEISTVPFVDNAKDFPPAGLVSYGDASVNAASPTTENFFSVEFNSLTRNFGNSALPAQFYLRVVPVDGSGHAAAKPSNWVRVDIR